VDRDSYDNALAETVKTNEWNEYLKAEFKDEAVRTCDIKLGGWFNKKRVHSV
jgi:hypothetical protein